jgi:hypothetical protein
MQWVIGVGLILGWLVMTLFIPRGWAPLLLLSGICVLIVQIAAYRKTKRHGDTVTRRHGDTETR